MPLSSATLGTCPVCGTDIPREQLIIKYETENGWPAMYAECLECRDIVHPT